VASETIKGTAGAAAQRRRAAPRTLLRSRKARKPRAQPAKSGGMYRRWNIGGGGLVAAGIGWLASDINDLAARLWLAGAVTPTSSAIMAQSGG